MVSRVGSVRAVNSLAMGEARLSVRTPDEPLLIRKAAGGDKDAYRELVERHQRRLFVSAFEVLRNREDAEDVVQEALARSFFSLKSFRGGSSLATWLQRIVFNLAIDVKRRTKRRGGDAVEFDERAATGGAERLEQLSASPETLLRRKQQRQRLMTELEGLSEEHRQAILLREFEGMSYDEIARIAGVSIGTVMSRLFYARKRLQSVLHEVR